MADPAFPNVPIFRMQVVLRVTVVLHACGIAWLLKNPNHFVQTTALFLLFD